MSVSTSPSDSALSKMVIHSFSDKDFQQEELDKLFTVPINPESFTKNYKVDLDNRTGHGQPGTQPGYKSSSPEELKIDFILDGTGTVEGYPSQYANVSVHDQLKAFLDCVYTFNGTIHRPNFVIVIWGSEIRFPGTVSSVDLNHTLFLPNGTPLRIKVSVTFVKSESDKARAAANKMQSPDLTHYHRVQRGDRLDLLTFSKYNDPNYFLQVGRVNNLVTVRKIAPPQEIYFPPFAQNET
jgi:hypothetical protein